LARNNIINPLLLDDIEIKKIIDFGTMPISINNLFEEAKVKVFQNNDIIQYTLKIPQIHNFCQLISIYPVIHEHKIISLDTNYAAKCDKYSQPLKNCNLTSSFNICQPSTSKCVSQILNENKATCSTETAHYLPPIQEIADGTIILNNVPNTNITEDHTISVQGTFLIQFKNQIEINNTVFKNNNINSRFSIIAHPPKLLTVKQINHYNKLSLPYLHEVNINNTHHINTLYQELRGSNMIDWILIVFSILTIITLFIFIIKVFSRIGFKKLKINEVLQNLKVKNEDVSELKPRRS
jgi:hypothetical protein